MTHHAGEHPIRWPGWERLETPRWMRGLNRLLGKIGSRMEVRVRFDPRRDMVTLEQVANLELLLSDLFAHGVPGDLAEFGSYTGGTASVIAALVQRHAPGRVFHVYDRFDVRFGKEQDIEAVFTANMRACGVPMPMVHKGDLRDTIPGELPGRICFAHIDCGLGGDPHAHAAVVRHCLEGIYDRMPAGAIIVLMDHHVPGLTRHGRDLNPGARMGADAFLADKPERFEPLYGGACSHAFMRKR